LAAVLLAGCGGAPPKPSSTTATPAPYRIVNVHEHIQSPAEAPKLLEAMDMVGVAHTILVGSPKATIVGKGGFVEHDVNNAAILTIQSTYPGRFSAYVTLDPRDPDKLRKLDGYVRAGARGVKLYSGHSVFYDLPLTDSKMEPVYDYLERKRIPVLWHVNLGKFGGELDAVLTRHPRLVVIIPHLGLSSIKLERIEAVLDKYPLTLTDLSFGYDPFLIAALRRISKDPERYRQFISRYRDRILFGSDMVVTRHKRKTATWLADVMSCYRGLLEEKRYRCILVDGETLNGLALDPETLRQIYERNPQRILPMRK
jgi:predicted TIM-barrel fold metal-dependent hydrolase